jgi:hypothetical protein
VVNQEFAKPYITQCFFNETGGTPTCSSNPNGNYNATLANPCGQGGGVWMSARGPASNANKEVFFSNGNGGFQYCPTCAHHCAGNPTTGIQKFTDFGEAVMGINMANVWSTTSGQAPFWPIDYFVPDAVPPAVGSGQGYFEYLNSNDWDLGVTGTLLFDDKWYDASHTHCATTQYICSDVSMLLSASKRGDGYVLLQASLGQIEAGDTGEVNNFMLTTSNPTCSTVVGGGAQCDEPRTPALWQQVSDPSVLVVWPWLEDLASFQWKQSGGTTSQFNFASVSTASSPFSGHAGYAGGTLALSFNPTDTDAVVWAVAPKPDVSCSATVCNPGYLLAYSLTPAGVLSSNPIWPTTLPLPTADFIAAPYAIPTVVNGKVYVPTYALSDGMSHYTKSGIEVYGKP